MKKFVFYALLITFACFMFQVSSFPYYIRKSFFNIQSFEDCESEFSEVYSDIGDIDDRVSSLELQLNLLANEIREILFIVQQLKNRY